MNSKNDESKNLINDDLQIDDFSRELKNLIEQPNSIKNLELNSNLIDLNSTKQNGYSFLSGFKEDSIVNDNLDNSKIDVIENKSNLIEETKLVNQLDNLQLDNRKFLTKDIDIFDFEHLNRHQKVLNDDKLTRFKNLNNFNSAKPTFYKLPFDSDLKPSVIQINSDNSIGDHFDTANQFKPQSNQEQITNSKFSLGYQEQASIDNSNLLNVNANLSSSNFKNSCCIHNTSNSSNNEEIEPLLSRSSNCSLCKNQNNKLQTQNSKMENEWAYHNNFPEDEYFNSVIKEAERSIEDGNYPIRILQGSSGSYFVRDSSNVMYLLFLFVCLLNNVKN